MLKSITYVSSLCLLLSIAQPIHALDGGTEAPANAAPYVAALLSSDDAFNKCAGVLVTPKTILTTASCVQNQTSSSLKARVGSSDRTTGGTVVNFNKIIQHPKYNTKTWDFDIALLSLSEAAPDNVPLATIGNFSAAIGSGTTMYGWGLTNYTHTEFPKKLQKLDAVGITDTWCAEEWKGLHSISNRMVCDWPPVEKATWEGDKGGPVVNTLDGSVVGLISFSIYETERKKALPDVHTNLEYFNSWIKAHAA
ncbi:uncharacterized protein N7443_005150 [Penicillium atrosanguineum]|uniref:trypsin n=1 Tax=Penicillium atrosanguineum TaxID=1132637 RepID=A0A9W9Q747_9EURO|nr:uncharacterized protein N7443_005150 [Penicillium atrosanguineum]KAJ5305490.1 hypothetical protein N7443_005150 [Penicillium atrosanguineum]KAJ5324953.1 Trypsin-like serine protease [Penicillium atrosanguineum]